MTLLWVRPPGLRVRSMDLRLAMSLTLTQALASGHQERVQLLCLWQSRGGLRGHFSPPLLRRKGAGALQIPLRGRILSVQQTGRTTATE